MLNAFLFLLNSSVYNETTVPTGLAHANLFRLNGIHIRQKVDHSKHHESPPRNISTHHCFREAGSIVPCSLDPHNESL